MYINHINRFFCCLILFHICVGEGVTPYIYLVNPVLHYTEARSFLYACKMEKIIKALKIY